ncbi:hypothetical protein O3G_MSEX015308 [Manduca sexta]|uniref:Exonuclease domain-containing protein n=1 Tax=Manduca sexta TaxID=7130 RepID=A0A921ZX21_MANSE|nr:hypothetical protein O3G_MSEX015308 [Manduca sexta]
MVHISSYVFFDIETTGLPWQERNRTKITELCFVATAREDLQKSTGFIPPVSKLTLALNPKRKINPEVTSMTGLTNEFLIHSPTFCQKSRSIIQFLEDLPRPVCLVAHNGNVFDYKIFLAECVDAQISLPNDIYCVDSLALFRKILKPPEIKVVKNNTQELWPELDVTPEDWNEIDKLCSPIKKICNISLKQEMKSIIITDDEDSDFEEQFLQECEKIEEKKTELIKKLFDNSSKKTNVISYGSNSKENTNGGKKKGEFTLSGLYERLLNKQFVDAHRAENDCIALLECVIATKDDFLPMADDCCKKLSEIIPLRRY